MQDNALTLHFAHANGFPSGSYRKLFNAFPDNYHVIAIEKMGHSSRFPVSNNWHSQADELVEYINKNTPENEPVYAVGHSFGAVVSFIAACRFPERFKGVIMLDPPLTSGISRHFFALAKKVGMIDKFTPAKLAETRKRRWQHSVDLVDYFAGKGLFKRMDRDCIADYVNSVIETAGDEQVLTFDPAVEAQLFRTVPSDLHRYAGKLKCPGYIITGEQTDVCVPFLRNTFIKENNLVHKTVPGAHMFPLERPQEIAQLISTIIDDLASSADEA
ncbi:alpha/beta fold hydrolase [Alteromonas facilis]|uniref:alpha/beta fold hydrolase n=1 Tax=Alteromonas facilis TaxID=2048004 RepID=UPI001F0CA706|nr:alpha/beta hydrolase [Alteromonas facilis]